MDGLFSESWSAEAAFTNFGASAVVEQKSHMEVLNVDDAPACIRKQLRHQCPRLPGVYGMVDQHRELIYVGMSSRLRDRLLTYFTKGPAKAKEQRIAARARRLIWEVGDHELAVRLRELELIRRWLPRFNSVGRPGRREVGYIYLSPGEAPNFRFGRRLPTACRQCWGPLPLSRRTRAAIKRLNRLFLLRDCPDRTPVRFSEQLSLLAEHGSPACIRHGMGTCLAPCAGDRSREDYFRGIDEATAFLEGRDRGIIDRYELAMNNAASAQRYEQAAAHRDTWQSLSALWDQLELLRTARRDHSGIYTLRGCSGKTWWALTAAGKVARIVRQPASRRAARKSLGLIKATFSQRGLAEPEDYDQMRIFVTWCRQHPQQHESMMFPDQAQEFCSSFEERGRRAADHAHREAV